MPQTTIQGMWLLDEEALNQLDAILDEECEKIQQDADRRFENAVKRAREEARRQGRFTNVSVEQRNALNKKIREDVKAGEFDFSGDTRQVKLRFQSARELTRSRFAEFLSDGALVEEKVTAFEVTLRRCGIECAVTFPAGGSTTNNLKAISVAVSPDGGHAEFFHGRLVGWVHEKKAPSAYVLWRRVHPAQWLLLLLAGLIALVWVTNSPKQALKVEAHQLVEEGVNEKNQHRATELILAILSDAPSRQAAVTVPFWIWPVGGASVLLCLLLSYCPDDAIGVGRGAGAIRRRKALAGWTKWIIVAIVFCGVVPSVAGNFLTDLVKRLFGTS